MTLITPKIEQYLCAVKIPLRLACQSTSGWPLVLSLWYLYRDGHLYCATQSSSFVVTCLKHEPRCAFEIAADQPPYCGVRGQGTATIEPDLGVATLQKLLVRYLGSTENQLGQRLLSQSQNEIAIVIKPVKIFTWNYTNRMQETVSGQPSKVCPE